ncbi:hypothetical protein ACPA9J_04230 [Pseudomonas aeruginosa]
MKNGFFRRPRRRRATTARPIRRTPTSLLRDAGGHARPTKGLGAGRADDSVERFRSPGAPGGQHGGRSPAARLPARRAQPWAAARTP